jgi:TDG/mug DNA glycosylase family protein
LAPDPRALFVGINPGVRSAAIGHHFAGFSNRFWKLLFDAGLVPEPLRAEDDDRLPALGFGITNLVARTTPGIADLRPQEYEAGRRRLLAKIRRYHPGLVVLVGVTLYRVLLPGALPKASRGGKAGEPTVLGLRPETLAGVPVFVVPNPSGRNANYSYAQMLDVFKDLARALPPPLD